MKLIDISPLLSGCDVRKVTEYDESGCGVDYKAIPVSVLEAAPVVDAEIVRHAHWVLEARGFDFYRYTTDYVFRCSECGLRANNKYPYCHCGCKMDGNEDV